MIKAVIFDVDGTLIDSVDLHAHAWVDAFKEFGHIVAFADMRRQIGKGGDTLLPVFLSESEIAEQGEALEERRGEILKERYLQHATSFRGVRDLFQRLRTDGVTIALASSAKADELQAYKDIAEIGDLIDVETSADDAGQSKPYPDIFKSALKRLQPATADQIVVVGDTPYDAQAASKAGLQTIGVLCGGWSEMDLREAGCIAVYRDPADLLAQYALSPLCCAAA